MSRTRWIRLIIALATLALASLITWIIGSESSPLYRYFLYNVGIPNAWGQVNLIPYLLSAIVGGHSGNLLVALVAFAAQWMFIGWLVSLLVTPRSR
jgi:hypothetical protein